MTSWPGPASSALAELLQGRQIRLSSPSPGLIPYFFDLATRSPLIAHWLPDGSLGDPSRFEQSLLSNPATFVVMSAQDSPMGLVSFYDRDLENGHAKLGVLTGRGPQ